MPSRSNDTDARVNLHKQRPFFGTWEAGTDLDELDRARTELVRVEDSGNILELFRNRGVKCLQ